MKGDFSEWEFDPQSNEIGVLHQQGRGLLDQDWNTATVIAAMQRQIQARDAIGPSVAAVPAEVRDSFKVTQADVDADGVDITLNPGRVWADGQVIQVEEWPSLQQPATYLAPPFNDAMVSIGNIGTDVKDAVVLEVWSESLNAFQEPLKMLEPALGGVDTTERAKLYHRLRLLRLDADDECGNLADKLADDFSSKGKLTVSAEEIMVTGDCPVEAGGGYTGFEHFLMRIEIAEPDGTDARFKWSRFNGGLVGRGKKLPGEDKVEIKANDQMINHCGLPSFYLEALEENTETGIWEIKFSATATLSADGELDLTNKSGSWPGGDGNETFFRLWDGIDLISNFPVDPNPNELIFGLRLQFDAAAADHSNYQPGDYWTFPVRAAGAEGFDADEAWPNDSAPQGIHYTRVPLAILTWDDPSPTSISAPDQIHDCRHVFQPLAQLDSCCSYTVGDGSISYGDFDSIQDAINALPDEGGEICVFDGDYPENLVINKDNVTIHGCGLRSHLMAHTSDPALHIKGASQVQIRNMQITAHDDGIGVLVNEETQIPQHITLKQLHINAAKRSAIEVDECQYLTICDNKIVMDDVASAYHALLITADDVLIEHNEITVERSIPSTSGPDVAAAGRGGLQLGGGSERVQIIDNLIKSGISNGITLGTVVEINESGEVVGDPESWVVNQDDECDPCGQGTNQVPPDDGTGDIPTYQSAGALYDIRIERNRILNFGMNGIGVVGFFDLAEEDEMISINNLQILGNTITGCLFRELEPIPDEMEDSMGYGGISLADAENLVIQDNVIEDNGPSHLEHVCGIFVLHVEGIDISRNRILNNGEKTSEPAAGAKLGPRGGIYIVYATAPKVPVEIFHNFYPRQNGVPAAKIHDNIVSQPLGRALSMTALGPVSVHGNQFTSQGFVFNFAAPSFWASTIYIFNLGISNEFYLQQILFSGEGLDDISVVGATQDDPDFIVEAQPGLDSQQFFAYLGNGNILFNDNQVMLDLTDKTGFQLGMTSIGIMTLDDLSFQDNQCDISYDFLLDEFILTQALVFGWTTRIIGNRFKESVIGTLLSAVTISLFANHTMMNQATHCIWPFNLTGDANLEDRANIILFDIFGLCRKKDPVGMVNESTSSVATAYHQPQGVLALFN